MKFRQLQNQLDSLKLQRQVVDPVEQIEALARELDCLVHLYQLAFDLDILTFQFILNNILDDGFCIANRVLKLHLKLTNQPFSASGINLPAVMKPPDAFLNRISSREEERSRGDESRAREEQESQRSFLQTAAAITAAAPAITAAAPVITETATASAPKITAAAPAPVKTATAAATTAGDSWLLQLGWFAREGARFVKNAFQSIFNVGI